MGSADWFRDRPADAVRMLRSAGVSYARGFALDTSHFDSVGRQLAFGTKIVAALAQDGIPHRHFVIDTSDNGRPFTGAWYHQHHPNKPLGYAKAVPVRRAVATASRWASRRPPTSARPRGGSEPAPHADRARSWSTATSGSAGRGWPTSRARSA